MRAIVFDGKLRVRADYPVPEVKAGEVLVRVHLSGICATDIEITKGYMGFRGVPGHEFVGTVERAEDKRLMGKRVVGEINTGCGKCSWCRAGIEGHCPERTVLGIHGRNGSFADFLALPQKNLHTVPDALSDEEAVFTEPLAAAFEITRQVDIGPNESVCILGDGRLGLLVAQALSLTGCNLVCVGRHPEKLKILEERGIETRLGEILERAFDLAVDCTGSPEGFNSAVSITKPRGTVVVKTTVAGRGALDLNRVVVDEITVVGSRCGPFEPAIKALKKKSVDVVALITKTFPIEQGVEAIEFAKRKDALKVLLKMA